MAISATCWSGSGQRFVRSLPETAWDRSGIASDARFTVRALAYIAAGHVEHHLAIVRARYL
jgi:hypothetical protein